MSAQEVRTRYPGQTYNLLRIFQIASNYAKKRGLFYADTKFEFSEEGVLCDEILTPDSSRVWSLSEWLESRKPETGRKAPTPFDKQLVREWAKGQCVHKLDPTNPEHIAHVHGLEVPKDLLRQTEQTYRYIFWRLTERTLSNYLTEVMGVAFPRKKKKIVVVCGSQSDLPNVLPAVEMIPRAKADVRVCVMSCHRNPQEVRDLAETVPNGVDAVLGVGGKALALPGILDAWMHAVGKRIPVVGVALGDPGSRSLKAAMLSIEELPGAPVIIDELAGQAYTDVATALSRIIDGELPPQKPRQAKPAQMDVFSNQD
jgi:phosphoribosylcarboxyaminoimidazole (NCAIR) mutase